MNTQNILYGKHYTQKNIFISNSIFQNYITSNNLLKKPILEPFAGANNLINHLLSIYPKLQFQSFDINPNAPEITQNDSINNWNYNGFELVITNPPYLSKNSATRKNLSIDFNQYDDLYKLCLSKCIQNVQYTIAIIPASFILSNRSIDKQLIQKLEIFQFIPDKNNFDTTEHPIALAYFNNQKTTNDFNIYENNNFINSFQFLTTLQTTYLKPLNNNQIIFNHPNGNLCVNTCDNTKDFTNIKFHPSNWKTNEIKPTNRFQVKILVKDTNINNNTISLLNNQIKLLRHHNLDYLWTPFKGTFKTYNTYRKRIPFSIIKQIIHSIHLK